MLLLETEGQTPDGSVRERQIAVEWRLQQEKQVSAHSFVLSWDEINVKVHFVCFSPVRGRHVDDVFGWIHF